MQIVSIGDNLHEVSKLFSPRKNKKKISKCCLLKFLPRELSVRKMTLQANPLKLLNFAIFMLSFLTDMCEQKI